jgi:3-mercaptopyruvate sulfurtransferase SseA
MVYCKSGGRSGEAATMMKEMGFTEVYNMQGGMLAWSNAGMPVDNSGASPKSSGLTQEDYQKQVSANSLVLVDFNATWCMPCKNNTNFG